MDMDKKIQKVKCSLRKRSEIRADPVVRDRLKKLYPGKEEEGLIKSFYQRKRKIAGIILITGFVMGGLLFLQGKSAQRISENGEIQREDYKGSAIQIPAVAYSEKYGEMDLDIDVDRQSYSPEETEKLFDRAEDWLVQIMPGSNESLDCVREDLNFPLSYDEEDIAIEYTSSNYALVNGSGEVRNEELEQEETVTIKVEFFYEDKVRKQQYEVTVYPPVLTQTEMFQKELKEILVQEDLQQRETEVLQLPENVGGEAVTFREKEDGRFLYMVILGVLCAFLVYRGMDRDLDKLYEKRQQSLMISYPGFVSKLALLTGAGMSVTGALRRIRREAGQRKDTPLYEELGIFVRELDNGKLEEKALADLGKRTGLPQYRKFCTLLSVNMKKGSVNLREMLEKEAQEAFEEHQLQIRKLGEEAGTKLLIPMVMMLAVVMIVIMVPAFMTYQM